MHRTSSLFVLLAIMAVAPGVPTATAHHGPPFPSGPDHQWGEMVVYPMVFPVGGTHSFSDSFTSPRCCDPGEIHHATDVMAARGTPVYAVTSGTVRSVNWSHDAEGIDYSRCCALALEHDDGIWESWYIHLNNDTPGTDDGQGSLGPVLNGQVNPAWGVAPGIVPGVHVAAGQLIGWVGDSGNAEGTSPHLHFELLDGYGVRANPYQALRTARDQGGLPRCEGRNATIFGDDDGDGIITGTDGADVIVGTMDGDHILALGGDDLVCGWDGVDEIDGGPGADTLYGDLGSDRLRGGSGADRIVGGRGHDRIYGGKGADDLDDGDGDDRMFGGDGDDVLRSTQGFNRLSGGPGTDDAGYGARAAGVTIDLTGLTGTDLLDTIEHASGSPFADVIAGDGLGNRLSGGAGNDLITGAGGDDDLIGGEGDDWLEGGAGDDTLLGELGADTGDGGADTDVCLVETATACES